MLRAALAIGLCGTAAAPASAANLCVAERGGCYRSIQKAVDAARDGDSIRVGPGVHAGGVTIDKNVQLRGAGASATRIRGGGPVLTLGTPFAPDPPTIAISGVTISDGVTSSAILDGVPVTHMAFGGGVLIPSSQDRAPGAAVTITDSVIERNVAAPSATVPSPSNRQCPGGPCPYAGGYGGGIYNAGSLTLTRTTVAANRNGTRPGAAPLASDAEGGGIFSIGPLTLIDSQVVDNESRTLPPNARYANGGGVFSQSGGVTLQRSTISGNRAILESSWPASVEQHTVGGGLFVGGDSPATIERSRIEDNALTAFNTVGDAIAFSGGLQGNGPVIMRDSIVGSNHVTASVPPGSTGMASADSGAGNLNVASTIAGSRLVANTATAVAGAGSAIAGAGALWAWSDDTIDVRGSVISGNQVSAIGRGTVAARGGGIVNVDALALRATDVSQNTVRAIGRSGEALGGGIFNGRVPDSQDFTPQFSAADSEITGNAIAAGPGIVAHGGGLFTSEPITLDRTRIRGNRPDQCAGC
ncbi:hypothetical protein OM076_01050 [Solirubrobacter ginsenosidimutans]|uniref:Right handed beta helix domain-containing protein n=1 Tax=Solirubrobacter ginsenosidimutans TaxID=490573 RepID=A0A9X3RXS0_9ACTN|nr:hypothetical protein [Solirubrobacter ginsenosidimutans]MDA0158835.1 hypothetical protein [Solirubrobacter ginsenosidimutans]